MDKTTISIKNATKDRFIKSKAKRSAKLNKMLSSDTELNYLLEKGEQK